MKRNWCCALVLFVLSAAAAPSHADEVDELRKLRDTTIALVNALVEQGVLTRAKADQLIAQAEQAGAKGAVAAGGKTPASGAPSSATAATGTVASGTTPNGTAGSAAAAAPGVVRVPYIPEAVKEDITNEVRQDVLAQAKTERWGEPGALPRRPGRHQPLGPR